MCDVAFLQMAGVAIGAVGQNRTARATERSAMASHEASMLGLQEQGLQENQAATDQMVERSRDAMREVGSLNAIFADSGLSGNSQDRVIAEAEFAEAEDLTTLERNRSMRSNQRAQEGAAIAAQTQSRINQSGRPSVIGTGLQIAGIEMERRRRAGGGKSSN